MESKVKNKTKQNNLKKVRGKVSELKSIKRKETQKRSKKQQDF